MSKKLKFTKEEIEKVVKESYSVAEVCRKMGWIPVNGYYRIFYRYVKDYDLDVSHFTGSKTNIGNRLNTHNVAKVSDYVSGYRLLKGPRLLKKLIDEGLKERKCECCGNAEWRGVPIPLQVHHIDGDCLNNKVENLQILCPNCHALTDNFKGRKNKKEPKKFYCKECGKEITRWAKTGLCLTCLNRKHGKTNIFSKETFIKLFKETGSFKKAGECCNCGAENMRKHAKKLGLPTRNEDLNKYIEENY